MTIAVGERLPEATFKVRTAEGLKDVTTADIAAAKRAVLFAVPGAFTPTCHAKHVPSYLENLDALRAKGCLLYTSPSPRDISGSRMPSSA